MTLFFFFFVTLFFFFITFFFYYYFFLFSSIIVFPLTSTYSSLLLFFKKVFILFPTTFNSIIATFHINRILQTLTSPPLSLSLSLSLSPTRFFLFLSCLTLFLQERFAQLSGKMESMTRVQNLHEVVCVSLRTNALLKGMNPYPPPKTMGK